MRIGLPVASISTWLSIGNGSRLVNRARQNPCLKPRSMSLEVKRFSLQSKLMAIADSGADREASRD